MRTNIRRGSAAAAVAALSAAALFALATGGSVGAVDQKPAPDPASSLALLRAAPTPTDGIAPSERAQFQPLAALRSLDLDRTRSVDTGADGTVHVIPGADADTVCVALQDPVDGYGVNCATTAQTEQGRLWTALVGMPGQRVGDARVAIVVPDGVRTIETVDGKGIATTQPVKDNLVVADLRDVAAYELTVGGVQVRQPLAGTPEGMPIPR